MRGLAALALMTALGFTAISPAVAGFLPPLLPGSPIVVEAKLVCGKFAVKFSGACGTDKPGWNNPNFFCKNAEKIDCTILADGQEKCCCKTFD